jgi:hypothetical protein
MTEFFAEWMVSNVKQGVQHLNGAVRKALPAAA